MLILMVGILSYQIQKGRMELFTEKHIVAQWLQFVFEHPDPTIIARKNFQVLNTNKACRRIFRRPLNRDLPEKLDPKVPETDNSWILNTPGTFFLY